MAKKDDKESRKSGLKMSFVAGTLLMLILIIWMFVYLYLDSKRIQISPEITDPIVTTPEETLALSAPVEVRFDASNIPVNREKYSIISSDWDFGDGQSGTGQIVSHIYEEKGRFDVVLTVTKRQKSTGEETQDKYAETVVVENEQLSAVIEADPQSGEAPLEVNLSGAKSSDPDGKIAKYLWDLNEDGLFDDAEGPEVTHTFKKIGTYTVALQVISTTEEKDIAEKDIIVGDSKDPKAVITVVDKPDSFSTNISYVFSAEDSTAPSGKIDQYEWDFGDGSKSQKTKTISHSFSTPGTYEVTLTVTDEEERTNETSLTVQVGAPKGTPKAVIETDPETLNGKIPFTVTFDAQGSTDSDKNIVDYKWEIEGPETQARFGSLLNYTFTKEGIYTVTLTVTDADNNKGTAKVIVNANPQGLTAAVAADKIDGTVPLTVSFDASGSSYSKGAITSYEWDFGDGTDPFLGTAKTTHKYKEIGTYTARVRVIGSDNSQDTAEIFITIREIPLEACFVSVFEKGVAPLETSFDPGCSTGTATSYSWNFGDGSTSTQTKPTHTYQKAGEYTATLEIEDANNSVSKAEVLITVTEK